MLTKPFLATRTRTFLSVLFTAMGFASHAHAQGAFSDNFNTPGIDSNFTNVAGTWTSSGGNYSVTANVQSFNFSLLTTVGYTNYGNFSLSYDVTSATNGGVVFHSDATAANGLVFIVRPDFNDAYFISRSGGAFGAPLTALTTLGAAQGSSLHVTLTGQGNNYTAVVSTTANPTVPIDTVVLNGNATAANYASGQMGLYSFGTGTALDRFDNLNIVPEPSAWAAVLTGGGLLGVVLRRVRRTA